MGMGAFAPLPIDFTLKSRIAATLRLMGLGVGVSPACAS